MTLSVYLTLFFMLGYLFLQQVWVYVLAFSYNENEAVFLFASVSKRVQVRNHSHENEFDLLENELAGGSHFHMNGFARSLVLTPRQKTTRK